MLALSGDYPLRGYRGAPAPVFDIDSVGLLKLFCEMNVVVTDELLALVERYGARRDKGRSYFVDLAAKQAAVVRGLGFNGVYLDGHTDAATFYEILQRAEGYAHEWRAAAREIGFGRPDQFYLFEPDPDTGLSSAELSRSYVESKRRRRTALPVPARYRFSRLLHSAVFDPHAPLFGAGRTLYARIEAAPPAVGRAAHVAEQAAKVSMFHCPDCGDCSLPGIDYVCPESMCAKNQRTVCAEADECLGEQ